MSNFYASPAGNDDLPESPELRRRAKIRRIANRHRLALLLWVVNALVVLVIGALVMELVTLDDNAERASAIALQLVISAAGGVLAWLVARELHARPAAAVLAVSCSIPGIAVIGLGLLSISANRFLNGQGIRVGLLGADPGQIH